MDIVVTTSCRLDGRAAGGAADTMKLRRDQPDAPCDADMEPLRMVLRRFAWRGRLRAWHADSTSALRNIPRRLGMTQRAFADLRVEHSAFEAFWRAVEAVSPGLTRLTPLRPSQLPTEIERARRTIRHLRWRAGERLVRGVLAPVEYRR